MKSITCCKVALPKPSCINHKKKTKKTFPLILPINSSDLNHVDVITPHRKKAAPSATHHIAPALPAGSTILPVPPNLVAKIVSGQFVEMGDLVPSHLGFGECAGTKAKQQAVANISEWHQAFAVYASVYARKQPQRVPDLMGYQILILEASSEYQNNQWLAYDHCFWQLAASQPNCKWFTTDFTLYNFAFTGQARANRCKHCFSLFHQSKDCEFAPNLTAIPHELPSHWNASCHKFICRQWNENSYEGCPFPNCRYEHVCYYYAKNPASRDCNHKAIFCPNPLARQPVPQQKPKPFFL